VKNTEKKTTTYLVLAGILAVALIAGIAVWMPWTPFPPPPPWGPYPELTYETSVKASYYWFEPAKIVYVKSKQVSSAMYGAGSPKILLFPFEGKVVLEVMYPNYGRVVVGEQKVSIEKGSDVTVVFYWKTKQAGRHVVIASLYDKDNKLVDQKKEEVEVPVRSSACEVVESLQEPVEVNPFTVIGLLVGSVVVVIALLSGKKGVELEKLGNTIVWIGIGLNVIGIIILIVLGLDYVVYTVIFLLVGFTLGAVGSWVRSIGRVTRTHEYLKTGRWEKW